MGKIHRAPLAKSETPARKPPPLLVLAVNAVKGGDHLGTRFENSRYPAKKRRSDSMVVNHISIVSHRRQR